MTGVSHQMTSLPARELEILSRATTRILCDYRDPSRGPFELMYMFSQTTDNEGPMFEKAVQLARKKETIALGIADGDLGTGYEGYASSLEKLKKLGLPRDFPIIKFEIPETETNGKLCRNVNTGSEAHLLARHIMAQSRRDIGILAPPHHIVRAFFTIVSALRQRQEKKVTRIYPLTGISLPWRQQEVRHSQNILKGCRDDLLEHELRRLDIYRTIGSVEMLLPSDILHYLNWRDG